MRTYTCYIGGDQMGYRILYEKGAVKINLSDRESIRKSTMFKWGLILASAIILLVLSQSSSFRRVFLPGNKDVTEAAVVELVDSIQRGSDFEEVITTFCRQIIENEE